MSKIKTTQELHPIRLLALQDMKAEDFKPAEFNGEVKTDENGNVLYRAQGFQVFQVFPDGGVRPVNGPSGQVSLTIAHPIDVSLASFYEPVGVYSWNDYDRFKTSIQLDTLKPFKA